MKLKSKKMPGSQLNLYKSVNLFNISVISQINKDK